MVQTLEVVPIDSHRVKSLASSLELERDAPARIVLDGRVFPVKLGRITVRGAAERVAEWATQYSGLGNAFNGLSSLVLRARNASNATGPIE